MAMQREQGTCTGRGFSDVDSTGYLSYLYTWITKTPAAGGPGWTILYDQSTYPTDKTISSVDTGTDVITATSHGFKNGDRIHFTTTGTLPGGLSTSSIYFVNYIDANSFSVYVNYRQYAYEDQYRANITSAGSGTHYATLDGPYIVVSNESSPAVMGGINTQILQIGYYESYSGYIYMQSFISPGVDSNSLPYGCFSGHWIKTVDAGPFTYDFRGGEEFLLLQSRVPADSAWYRAGTDKITRVGQFVEDPSTVYGVVDMSGADTAYTSGSTSQVITLTSSAQANSFTVGNYYYIIFFGTDVSGNRRGNVVYGRIDAIGTADGLPADTDIRFDWLSGSGFYWNIIYDGSIISPYYNLWCTYGNLTPNSTLATIGMNFYNNPYPKLNIPYCSYNTDTAQGHVCNPERSYITGSCFFSVDSESLIKQPMDNGVYACQKPLIVENTTFATSTNGMNQTVGEMTNVALTSDEEMTDMELGVTISAEDWISLGDSSLLMDNVHEAQLNVIVIHTEST